MNHKSTNSGATLFPVLAVGVLAVSSAAVLIRLADAPALVIASYRLGIASVLLSPLVLRRPRRITSLGIRELGWLVLSGGFLALHFGFWISSLHYTSVASSVVFVTSSPLMVALASWLLLRERISRREVAGITLGIVGGVVIALGDWRLGREELLGDLLALAGAVAVTGYLTIGRWARADKPVLAYVGVVYPTAAALLVGATAVSGASFTGYPASTYLWLVMVALIPQVVGHTSFNWVLRHVTATVVAITVMAEPVLASALAWVVLDEAPPVTSVIGGALILSGVYAALRRGSNS